MRLSGFDRGQELTVGTGNGGTMYYSFYDWSTSDSMMHDSIMFYKRGGTYHGFEASTNRYYILENGVKKLYFDFSLPAGSTFYGIIGGSTPTTVNGSGDWRTFTAHYGFWPTYDIEITTARYFGNVRDYDYMVQSSNWSSFTTTPLSRAAITPNGDTVYIEHNFIPYMTFNPPVSPSSTWLVTFNIFPKHTLSDYLAQHQVYVNSCDSTFFEYFYTNGSDSTELSKLSAKSANINQFSVTFDSTIIQRGYHVKYRTIIRDKSARPKYAYSPADESYHTLHIDPTVGIEDEPVPDNFFQVAAYPNPFNNSTTLQIDHFESGEVTVNIYSLTGEKVMEPVLIHKEVGTLTVPIEFKSQPSGIYLADINFVSFSGKMHRKHQKLVYLK